MGTSHTSSPSSNSKPAGVIPHHSLSWRSYLPIMGWWRTYNREAFAADVIAGLIVAIMLIPQGMAYALLAGLPAQIGLYASILPLILYGLMGTSRTLAVGPVAMVSLLVASSVGPLAEAGVGSPILLALTLAFMVGVIQTIMGLLRVGFLVNFLSHPVLSGFTSAAAIIIGFSQLKHVLGFPVPRTEYFYTQVWHTIAHVDQINWPTFLIGMVGIAILVFFKHYLAPILSRINFPESLIIPITKGAPLVVVGLGTAIAYFFRLDQLAGVAIVGDVPAGLPPLTLPSYSLDILQALLPAAITISLVGYMESISVAKSLASKRRQKIDPDQELIALGVANLGAGLTSGYPVTGGISRSVVNFSAGARSGMSSIITAVLIAFTVLFLTPIFTFLPKALLAAIILVAIAGMIDFRTFIHVWGYNKADGISLLITFLAVLAIGVETGILVGVAAAITLYIWRTSRPHMAIVGQLNNSEIYRNVQRHTVETWPHILAMRIDESLYFANTRFLEDTVLSLIAERPEVEHFILIGTAINFIDASAVETLEQLHISLQEAGVQFHLAAIKGPVLDQLEHTHLFKELGRENITLTTHDAVKKINQID